MIKESHQIFMRILTNHGFLNLRSSLLRKQTTISKKNIKLHKFLMRYLIRQTKSMNIFRPDIYERMRFFKLNIMEHGDNYPCPVCLVNPRKYGDYKTGYLYTCGLKDQNHLEYINIKRQYNLKLNNNQKYGCDYTSQLKSTLIKCIKTNNIKYGCDYPIQLDSFKDKRVQTNLERYGVSHPMKLPEIYEKYAQSMINIHGSVHPPSMEITRQETNLSRYGVITPSQLPSAKIKRKYTCLKKYGRFIVHYPDSIFKRFKTKYNYINIHEYMKLSSGYIKNTFLRLDNTIDINYSLNVLGIKSPSTIYKLISLYNVKYVHSTNGRGFNPELPATLYYIFDPESNMYKIGITNKTIEERFGKTFCSDRAIAILEQTSFENGADAYIAEQEILEAFSYARCVNDTWPEAKGGKTEFFNRDILHKRNI